jgi:hypothetical protein
MVELVNPLVVGTSGEPFQKWKSAPTIFFLFCNVFYHFNEFVLMHILIILVGVFTYIDLI